jgi:hypothetical protein
MRMDIPASCLRDHLQGDMDEGSVALLKRVSAIRKMASAIMEVKGGAVCSLPSYSHVPVAPPLGVVGVICSDSQQFHCTSH